MKIPLVCILLAASWLPASSLEPVGYSVPFRMEVVEDGRPSSAEGVVAFPDASFVKVHLGNLQLDSGDSLVVSDGEKEVERIDGPFSGERWLVSTGTGAAIITVESRDGMTEASYSIDEVGVGLPAAPVPESVCGTDDRKNAVCFDSEKQTSALPVGRMLFSDGSGWYLCTGSLVSANGHFLTNNHCIEDEYGASTLEVWWKYQTTNCDGSSGKYDYVTTGSTFLVTDYTLDFSLLQIPDASLFNRYGYLKIAARTPVKGETIWIPQHGGGKAKTFAVDSDLDGGAAKVVVESIRGNAKDTDIGYWADTEGGSSGSPVLDSNNKILALHHFGVYYSCSDSDLNQGVKMSLIYPEIAELIGNIIPPAVSSIEKATDPFRLIIKGSNFKEGMTAYLSDDPSPWPYFSYKSDKKFVLKGNKTLKNMFPKGTPVSIRLVNTDGGTVYTTYTR